MAQETEKDIDYRLMRAIQNGDMVAFNTMVDRYKKRLMNVLSRMLSSTEEAEDIVQETFIRLYRRIGQFDSGRPFAPYLMRCVVNAALNAVRGGDKTVSLDADPTAERRRDR